MITVINEASVSVVIDFDEDGWEQRPKCAGSVDMMG
jgi:hypothetical protein